MLQTKLNLGVSAEWRFQETGVCYGPNSPLRSVVGGEETGMYNTDQSHPWSQVFNNNNDDDNNNNEALF